MQLPDKLRELTHATFEEISKNELRPSYDLTGLKLLREKAARERDLRELHRTSHQWGRVPYELLQNADDAHASRAVFILSPDGLAFAHDGCWFTVDNFRSLADGWSDKNPKECIGHKGLGFRSVLDITPAPHLLKVSRNEFFGIKFSWAVNNGHIQEALRRDPGLREHHDRWIKQAQPFCPIMAIPTLAKRSSMVSANSILDGCANDRYGPQLTTLFWFPERDPDLPTHLLRELSPRAIVSSADGRKLLREFVSNDLSTILPFLAHIEHVSVYQEAKQLTAARRFMAAPNQTSSEISILIETDGNVVSKDKLFILREDFSIPSHVKNLPDTPLALRRMEKAKAALALRLSGQPICDKSAVFHVYFPTEERTGTGFTIHGDFYVKPDRTRLMPSEYNNWLFGQIAKLAATQFLDQLLVQYRPARVYEALAPVEPSATTDAGKHFLKSYGEALKKRQSPFIATRKGLLRRQEVALPPRVDEPGFWESHFQSALPTLYGGKLAFFKPDEDTVGARLFLEFAGLEPLRAVAFLDLLEWAGEERRTPQWWYECYGYMAKDHELSRRGRDTFVGRRILLVGERVIPVPRHDELIVSLPPTGAAIALTLPSLFAEAFVLLNPKLAELLESGPDTIASWVTTSFHVARFEATELLPRAVRRAAPRIFLGSLDPTAEELADAWVFIFSAINLSRRIESSEFWNDLGRFPVMVETADSEEPKRAPAFLVYWPDALMKPSSALYGVSGLRRLAQNFFTILLQRSQIQESKWITFLEQVGLSGSPKLLRFSRIANEEAVVVTDTGNCVSHPRAFKGERQADENVAVLSAIQNWPLWDKNNRPDACPHSGQRILQTVNIIDGFWQSVEKAVNECHQDDPNWKERLWSLIRALPVASSNNRDTILLCRAGGREVHPVVVGCQVLRQLMGSPWLPSSHGPAPLGAAFARLATRRLIGSGVTGEELGDALLPYVIADDPFDLERLRHLGVNILEDAPSANPETLVSALRLLGEALSSSPMREYVLTQPGRRRLVRGAIQEIYRALNQAAEIPILTGVKLAVRTTAGTDFSSGPFYFAESGSPVEHAFIDRLPLVDVDRAYQRVFDAAGVTRLIIGRTVHENFLCADRAIPIEAMEREIVDGIGPYLLAVLLVRADPEQARLVVRRLTGRFKVFGVPSIKISLSCHFDPVIQVETVYPHAYLRKALLERQGATEEAHYALYLRTDQESISIHSLDGDAIGETLAPVFLDGASDEPRTLFPRVLTRYQLAGGDQAEMKTFLFEHLNVSLEAQETARAMLKGEEELNSMKPPPPAIILGNVRRVSAGIRELTSLVAEHESELKNQAQGFLKEFLSIEDKEPRAPSTSEPSGGSAVVGPSIYPHISPEQKIRGRRGEDEILRRLALPGGWEGFLFVADHRDPPRGYDFLASLGGKEVKLEIKTFSADGQIVVTEGELREAAKSRSDYFLVGVLDDGGPSPSWKTAILPDPIETLLKEGQFRSKPELRLSSQALFRQGR